MQAFGRLSSYISQGVYTVSAPFHPFGGAVDIIVVQQQDGSLKSSPWYVQFGKFQGVLKTQEKVVKILVNEADAGLHMYLDHKGEAFFLKESDNGAIDGPIVSPLTSEDETDEGPQMRKSQMLDFESNQTESVSKIDVENGKIVARTNSRRSRIFGFFGRRSMREDSGQDQVSIKRLNSLESAERAADLLEMKWSTNLPATRITDRSLPRPPSRKDDNEETGMNIVEKGSLSSGKDPDSCNQGRNLPQSPSKKDDGKEFNMNIDKKRSLSSGEDPHPCTQGNRSVSDADLANMEHSSPVDTAEGSQCIEPQEEEDATSTSVCPVVYNSETSASVDSDENITDMPVSVLEKSDRGAVSDGHTVETVVESKGITSPRDTAHENYDETLKGPLSSDYAVETVISDGKTKLPQDALLENSDQPLKGPLVIANNEEKTSLVDTVPDKFQAFEVPSRPSNHTVQTVILNSMENASDDGNADVSGFRDADLNLKLSVQEKGDIGVSSCVLYETETYGTSTVTLDFINGELQSSGPTRERNELIRVNDPEIYGTANFAPEVNLTQPVTSVSVNHLVDHYSPCIGISNHYGDTTNLKQDAFQNLTESDKTKSSDSESKKPETQFPSDMDVESYESIVKILQENVVHMENEEKEDETVSDTIFENQVQCEGGETNTSTSDTIGSETLQHASCSLDVESKNTTLVSIAKTNNSVQNIFEEVAIGEVDNSVEHVSVRDCGPDNSSKSDLLVSADYEMPNSSEGGWFIARNIDKIANDGPPPQQLIADVNIEENLPRARMKDQDSRLTSVDDTKLSDDCYDESINQSSDIRPLTVANYIESNAFVQSTLSGVSSDIINSNDLDDSYSVSYFNQLSTNKTNIDENEACTSSGLEEGSIRKQVDQTSNASAADPDTCNIVEATKVPKVAVEVSLCRHLLFEGMGEEAASEAFEAEKLNLEKFASAGPVIVKNSKLIVKIGRHYFPWEAATPIILGLSSFDKDDIFEPEGAIPVKKIKRSAEQDSSKSVTRSGTWKIWPFGSTKSKEKGSEDRSPDGHKEIGTTIGSDDVLSDIKNMSNPKDTKKKVYSRIPSTEQLASLNLKEGQNSVTFSFETAMLGRQQVDARIYLWKWNAHIVISDVDGTITKSDVLGQFMPLVGKDWSQTGVAHLFSAIKENGYQFIFLSARSISQAYITRQFLFNLKQDGKALPDGPVVISPDGLFPSLYREVIRRAPHEFKISCLEDIKALFPPDCNPFYAGFGNRHTDEISYVKVGVPKGKIFTINPRGEIVVNRTVDAKSYVSLHALVDAMFPPTNSSEQEEFNSWNFWKPSLPDIKI